MRMQLQLQPGMLYAGQDINFLGDWPHATIHEIVQQMPIGSWILWDADEFKHRTWHAACRKYGLRVVTRRHPTLSAYIIQRIA